MITLETGLYLRVQELKDGPKPYPLQSGFNMQTAYRALGMFNPSETSKTVAVAVLAACSDSTKPSGPITLKFETDVFPIAGSSASDTVFGVKETLVAPFDRVNNGKTVWRSTFAVVPTSTCIPAPALTLNAASVSLPSANAALRPRESTVPSARSRPLSRVIALW